MIVILKMKIMMMMKMIKMTMMIKGGVLKDVVDNNWTKTTSWLLKKISYNNQIRWSVELDAVISWRSGGSLGRATPHICQFFSILQSFRWQIWAMRWGNPCQAIEKEGFLKLGQLNLPRAIETHSAIPHQGWMLPPQNGAIKQMALNSNWKKVWHLPAWKR